MLSSVDTADQIIGTVPLIVRALWNRLPTETSLPVTFPQLGLLSMLDQECLTLSDLAQRWGVSAPTMSKTVSLLVDRGWVVRKEDPADRRRKLLSLTPAGCEIQKEMYGLVQNSVARSLDSLDGEKRAQIVSALCLLLSTLS
jgi:DNA-binding MarR family transcriptional regulator